VRGCGGSSVRPSVRLDRVALRGARVTIGNGSCFRRRSRRGARRGRGRVSRFAGRTLGTAAPVVRGGSPGATFWSRRSAPRCARRYSRSWRRTRRVAGSKNGISSSHGGSCGAGGSGDRAASCRSSLPISRVAWRSSAERAAVLPFRFFSWNASKERRSSPPSRSSSSTSSSRIVCAWGEPPRAACSMRIWVSCLGRVRTIHARNASSAASAAPTPSCQNCALRSRPRIAPFRSRSLFST